MRISGERWAKECTYNTNHAAHVCMSFDRYIIYGVYMLPEAHNRRRQNLTRLFRQQHELFAYLIRDVLTIHLRFFLSFSLSLVSVFLFIHVLISLRARFTLTMMQIRGAYVCARVATSYSIMHTLQSHTYIHSIERARIRFYSWISKAMMPVAQNRICKTRCASLKPKISLKSCFVLVISINERIINQTKQNEMKWHSHHLPISWSYTISISFNSITVQLILSHRPI